MELKLFVSNKLNEIFSVIGGGTEMNPKSYNQYKSQISSKSLAEKLGLNPSMLNEFENAYKQFIHYSEDPDKSRIVSFRLALWMETISKQLEIEFEISKTINDEFIAIKQARALELMIRDSLSENFGGQESILKKLNTLFKEEVIIKWLNSADESGVLSGTTFSELSNILLNKSIFESFDNIFSDENISISKSARDSLRSILEDTRRIRNVIAHNKKISQVQIEALNEYYTAIAKILDESHLKISSSNYLKIEKGQLENFISKLEDDNNKITGQLDSINEGLRKIDTKIDDGFIELGKQSKDIQTELRSKWVSKKFIILYTIIISLSALLSFSSYIFITRPIDFSIRFSWVSDQANFKFDELKKNTLMIGDYTKQVDIDSKGMLTISNIPYRYLNSPIMFNSVNNRVYQLDTPIIARIDPVDIRLHVLHLDNVKFRIRDEKTGLPINNATIRFLDYTAVTDMKGSCSVQIPITKQSRYITFDIQATGYKYFKLNDVAVHSEKPIEILLENI